MHDSNELRKSIPGEVKGEITGHLEKAPKPFQQNLGFFPDSSKSKFSNDQNNQKNFSKPQEFSNSETDLNSGKSSYNMMSFIMSKMLDQNKEENFPDKKDKEKYLYFLIEKSMEIVKDQEFISKLLLQNKSGRGGPPSDSDKTLLISLLMK